MIKKSQQKIRFWGLKKQIVVIFLKFHFLDKPLNASPSLTLKSASNQNTSFHDVTSASITSTKTITGFKEKRITFT